MNFRERDFINDTVLGISRADVLEEIEKQIKRYEIYLTDTDEVLATGYNEFTALNNLVSLRSKYGNDKVAIKWIK